MNFHDRQDLIAAIARANGCNVYRAADGIPYCSCKDERHYCDQQSSRITMESAKRRRLRIADLN